MPDRGSVVADGEADSDLSVHMTATDGTATVPWPRFGNTFIDTGIRVMGWHSTTNLHIDRFEMEGSADSTTGIGFNVNNGIMYTGEFSSSSANPLDSVCGDPDGFQFVSGLYTVRNSSFKSMGDGVSQDGCVRSSQVTIGGSLSAGNTFENLATSIDLESAERSNFEISYNNVSGIYYGIWVVPWIDSVFMPSKPSQYWIHDNTFLTTASGATGILLYNDTPQNPWIDADIWNNRVRLEEDFSDGIDTVNTKSTRILNNKVTGSGWDAIGLYGSASSTALLNNVSGFAPNPSTGSVAQIYLDPGTSRDLIVCTQSATVLNQGTNNMLVGCSAATVPQFDVRSEVLENSVPHYAIPKGKQSPYRP